MNSGYLLDTSILSLLAPGRPGPNDQLAGWLRERADTVFLSAVTVTEIEQGICKLRRTGATERADRLTQWLDSVIAGGGANILAFDYRVGRLAGAISDRAMADGRHPGFADVAIAATAVAHDLGLLTRNGRHFAPLGVAFVDPVDGLPANS